MDKRHVQDSEIIHQRLGINGKRCAKHMISVWVSVLVRNIPHKAIPAFGLIARAAAYEPVQPERQLRECCCPDGVHTMVRLGSYPDTV